LSLAYGIIAIISLSMVGICVLADKKRDEWLIWLFVSVAVCNLGYFMLSVSKELDAALNSNRITYLGSVFLPFFLLMMVQRFCKIKRNKKITTLLILLGVVMLGITTSPGILPIYYKTVGIEFAGGGTKLVREYGPRGLTPSDRQFIADRFRDKDYVPRSYFVGATPDNNYEPSEPLTIKFFENPYARQNIDEGYLTLQVESGGADSPRQIRLRTKPSTGEWFLWEQFILSDIRPPKSADPWA